MLTSQIECMIHLSFSLLALILHEELYCNLLKDGILAFHLDDFKFAKI